MGFVVFKTLTFFKASVMRTGRTQSYCLINKVPVVFNSAYEIITVVLICSLSVSGALSGVNMRVCVTDWQGVTDREQMASIFASTVDK